MKLIICKQGWNPDEISESWEINPNGKAEVTFSKSPTGAFYTEVKDRVKQKILVPADGIDFLKALHSRLQKSPFTTSYIDS